MSRISLTYIRSESNCVTKSTSNFTKPLSELSAVVLLTFARYFALVADIVGAFLTFCVIIKKFLGNTEGFFRCFPSSGDTDLSNLMCIPRPLHFRRKQLSLAESSPVGEREQLWFWFCVVPSSLLLLLQL